MEAHHHHAGHPEKDDVEAGDEDRGRVEALERRGALRPSHGRERPQRRAEPGVEHVAVAERGDPRGQRGHSTGSVLSTNRLACSETTRPSRGSPWIAAWSQSRQIPSRDLMPPPELARDAPVAKVLHPAEVDLVPVLGDEARAGLRGRLGCRFGERPDLDEPLTDSIGSTTVWQR